MSADEGDSQDCSSPWRIEGRKLQTEFFHSPGLHSEILMMISCDRTELFLKLSPPPFDFSG